MNRIDEFKQILPLVFKALAIAMAVAALVLTILKTAPLETVSLLLGIGLFSIALNSLIKEENHE